MGYEFTVTKGEERMNTKTLFLTAMALSIIWAITPAMSEGAPIQPEFQPIEVIPTPPPPAVGIFRMNRDVPCTSLTMIQAILGQRGQAPIASGSAIVETELFNVIVLALNDDTGEFSLVIVNEQNQVGCNIYSGKNFRLIGQ